MRYEILKGIKQLVLVDDASVYKGNHVNHACFSNFDLRLANFPLN